MKIFWCLKVLIGRFGKVIFSDTSVESIKKYINQSIFLATFFSKNHWILRYSVICVMVENMNLMVITRLIAIFAQKL